MSLFRLPYLIDPPRDGRHPDAHYRPVSATLGQGITRPGEFFIGIAMLVPVTILVTVFAVKFMTTSQPASSFGLVLIARLLLLLLAGGLLFITVSGPWWAVRWRAERRRFAMENGTPDLGYFGRWDGQHSEARARRLAQEIVRANLARDRDG